MTEFTQCAVALNEVLVVTSNFFRKDTGLVDTSVTVLAVTLQEGTGDEVTLLAVLSSVRSSTDSISSRISFIGIVLGVIQRSPSIFLTSYGREVLSGNFGLFQVIYALNKNGTSVPS